MIGARRSSSTQLQIDYAYIEHALQCEGHKRKVNVGVVKLPAKRYSEREVRRCSVSTRLVP
jgi:hypothetical protein